MIYFQKSASAPDCLAQEQLKKTGNYKCGCVLELLKADFKGKCYICENKAPTSINVEHFQPHQGNVELKFAWRNLFLACGHCNSTKHKEFYPLLNCTDLTEAKVLEQAFKYGFKPFPYEKVRIEVCNDDEGLAEKVQNTQNLLLAVFNGVTDIKIREAENLCEQLMYAIQDFQEELTNYYCKAHDDDDKTYHRNKIKSHLNSASAFTAFKRQIIKDNPVFLQDFGGYIE